MIVKGLKGLGSLTCGGGQEGTWSKRVKVVVERRVEISQLRTDCEPLSASFYHLLTHCHVNHWLKTKRQLSSNRILLVNLQPSSTSRGMARRKGAKDGALRTRCSQAHHVTYTASPNLLGLSCFAEVRIAYTSWAPVTCAGRAARSSSVPSTPAGRTSTAGHSTQAQLNTTTDTTKARSGVARSSQLLSIGPLSSKGAKGKDTGQPGVSHPAVSGRCLGLARTQDTEWTRPARTHALEGPLVRANGGTSEADPHRVECVQNR